MALRQVLIPDETIGSEKAEAEILYWQHAAEPNQIMLMPYPKWPNPNTYIVVYDPALTYLQNVEKWWELVFGTRGRPGEIVLIQKDNTRYLFKVEQVYVPDVRITCLRCD